MRLNQSSLLVPALLLAATGTIHAAVVNVIGINMNATPTATCAVGSTNCSPAIMNLTFANVGGVETLSFDYTSSFSGRADNSTSTFTQFTDWIDTGGTVGTLLVSGTSSSAVYHVEFCEPNCGAVPGGATASTFEPVTVDYTSSQIGFEMNLVTQGTIFPPTPNRVAPHALTGNGQLIDIYTVQLNKQTPAVPEPASASLIGLAGACGVFWYRRLNGRKAGSSS